MSPQLSFAGAKSDAAAQFIKSVDKMMIELAPESSRASATIKSAYRLHLDLLVLEQYAALEDGLGTGGLVRLPFDLLRFNLKVRTDGPAPIAEKDLDNQTTYMSARPAALGALLEVASRVTSGPVEVTSLVRHSEYQDALRKTNGNARTSVPTHTMGLAFDIAVVNTPLETVYEIRDVLSSMQAAGDILVIGERQQLVFHVVPHPSRLGYFSELYARRVAEAMPGANVIPSAPMSDTTGPLRPAVSAEIVSVTPTEDFADEWWAAADAFSDMTVAVSAAPAAKLTARRSFFGSVAARIKSVFGSVFGWLVD